MVLPSVVAGDGLSLSVYERGRPDGPPVVLVHGYPDTAEMWRPVAERLGGSFRVVAYDVRGAGRSGAPAGTAGYRFVHLLADLAAVVDAASPDRPVHLVGHDWGSIQGWQAVTDPRFDGRVASFTSLSGPPLFHVGRSLRRQPGAARLRQAARSWYVAALRVPVAGEVGWRMASGAWRAYLERTEGVTTDASWPGPTVADDGARGAALYRANMTRGAARPHRRRTAVPVQLIVARRDRYVTPALLADLEEVAPDLRRREADAGHWLPRSRPDEVAAWITEHVEDVERRR